MLLDHSFPREVEHVQKNNIPLVIVGGTVEYHGSHCSYGCDTLVAEGLVKKVAEHHLALGSSESGNATKIIAERIKEIARIMTGTELTENTISSAKELLDRSKIQ